MMENQPELFAQHYAEAGLVVGGRLLGQGRSEGPPPAR